MSFESEKNRQRSFFWDRSYYGDYTNILAYFQAQSVLENSVGESLLDLACGDGTVTSMVSPQFKKVVGVDASDRHLIKARERCPQVEFIESLIENYQPSEKFDTVMLLDILEHVVEPVSMLRKASSFLKKDGILIIHVPNALAINRRLARIMGTLSDEYELSPFDLKIAGHRRSYDVDLLRGDIRAAGLKIKSTGGIFYKMFSTPQMDWFLKNGLWEGNEFGWGRVGGESKDWRKEFCRACYEIGKEHPDDCNIIYACATRRDGS